MRLANMCFPFAVEIQSQRGDWHIQGDARSIVLADGVRKRIAAYRNFGIWLATRKSPFLENAVRPLWLRVLPLDPSNRLHDTRTGSASSRPMTLSIAKAVFFRPDADWSRALAAAMFGVSKEVLSARMLIEGSALTQIVLEQRLMRTLVDIAHGDRQPSGCGFPSIERRDSAFYDRFGIGIEEFHHLARTGYVRWLDGFGINWPQADCKGSLSVGPASKSRLIA